MQAACRSLIGLSAAFALMVSGSLFAQAAKAQGKEPHYHLVKREVLGGPGRWDYFEVQPSTHRIFIPRGTHVMVLNPEGKVLGDIQGLDGTHGIDFAPDLGRAFLTDGHADSVTVIHPATLKVVQVVHIPDRAPDGILYDPTSKRVFTFNEEPARDSTAIDARTGKIVGSVELPDKAETAQSDEDGHIYVNIEAKGELTEFDSRTLKVMHTWSLAPCRIPTGLSIDRAHKRLFVGCRSRIVAVFDYSTDKVVATWPIGGGVDATRYDPRTRLVFASGGDDGGTITVAHQDTPDKYTVVQTLHTERGARTMALDPGNHNVYTVTSDFGPPPPATKEEPRRRPEVISSTFRLLIYGR